MSRDDVVTRLVDEATRRARMIAAAESAAAGAIVAAWSLPMGMVAAIACAIWLSRRTRRRAVVRALDAAHPRSHNLLVTADELSSGALDVRPHVRARVVDDAAAIADGIDIRALYPARRLSVIACVAAAAWLLASAAGTWRGQSSRAADARGASQASTPTPATPPALRITASLQPPPYTHRPPTTVVDPSQLQAIEHSTLRLAVTTASGKVEVETADGTRALSPESNGSFEYTQVLTKSGYVLVTAGNGSRRMIPITVTPDALPAVRIAAPGRDLVYSGGNPRIAFTAEASDDFGLRTLTLHFTKVSGSGEQFEFKDGEIPLAIAKSGAREWKGTAARALSELDLAEGDMLVYRAVASDERPGGGEASSDAFFIEMSRLGVAAGDAFTLPEQETRYALSQQMLIVKTERLDRQRASMPPESFQEASQGLAVEQRMIRSEFVFMLGGEIEDEEVEAEQSVELQAGRLQNRGQRDLRAATVAMSQAEKLLTAASTAEALKAERVAVEALQRAFSKDRYILRALATRSPLDPNRRLTGSVSEPLGWRRLIADAPENRRAALLQSLLDGLGEAGTRATPPAQLSVLAELAIRVDTDSAALRQIAADLQKLADAWPAASPEARTKALDAIAGAVATEARRTLADPPAAIGAGR